MQEVTKAAMVVKRTCMSVVGVVGVAIFPLPLDYDEVPYERVKWMCTRGKVHK